MVVIYFILLVYCCLVLVLWLGWNKAVAATRPANPVGELSVTVVVPFRNEQQHIPALLEALNGQHYKNFEIIMVDDHSEDNAVEIIRTLARGNLKIIQNPGQGKKEAISAGVREALGDIIVTTDADCSMRAGWLGTTASYFQNEQVMMTFGGVRLEQPNALFFDLQAVEFASLIGTGAATAAFNNPVMCNGANLAYRRNAFQAVDGYSGNLNVSSGDDEFLMRKVNHAFPASIRFIADKEAVVTTQPQPDLHAVFQQRIRWASKWKYNSSAAAVALAFFILASQASMLMAFASVLLALDYWALLLLAARFMMEALLLFQVCRFLKHRWSWLAFTLLQFIYPFYVLTIGILSNVIPYVWKGRKGS